jgi:hypothetical protein
MSRLTKSFFYNGNTLSEAIMEHYFKKLKPLGQVALLAGVPLTSDLLDCLAVKKKGKGKSAPAESTVSGGAEAEYLEVGDVDEAELKYQLVVEIAASMQQRLKEMMLEYRNSRSPTVRAQLINRLLDETTRFSRAGNLTELSAGERSFLEIQGALIRNMFQYIKFWNALELGADGAPVPIQPAFNLGEIALNRDHAKRKPEWDKFLELEEYFEFPSKWVIKLKVPYDQIPGRIWDLYYQAQLLQLEVTGDNVYRLDPEVTKRPPRDLLYLPIQCFGALENKATDSVNTNADGAVELVETRQGIFLSGGGQIEVWLEPGSFLRKCVEERLEEMYDNLFQAPTVQAAYDSVDKPALLDTLNEVLKNERYVKFPRVAAIIGQMRTFLASDLSKVSNHEVISRLILKILEAGRATLGGKETREEELLDNLRAELQVKPFTLADVFATMLERVQAYNKVIIVQQFCDTRGMASEQKSFVLVNIKKNCSVADVVRSALPDAKIKLGDDLKRQGAQKNPIHRLSLSQYIGRHYGQVRFSHDLNVAFGILMQRTAGLFGAESIERQLNAGDMAHMYEVLKVLGADVYEHLHAESHTLAAAVKALDVTTGKRQVADIGVSSKRASNTSFV